MKTMILMSLMSGIILNGEDSTDYSAKFYNQMRAEQAIKTVNYLIDDLNVKGANMAKKEDQITVDGYIFSFDDAELE